MCPGCHRPAVTKHPRRSLLAASQGASESEGSLSQLGSPRHQQAMSASSLKRRPIVLLALFFVLANGCAQSDRDFVNAPDTSVQGSSPAPSQCTLPEYTNENPPEGVSVRLELSETAVSEGQPLILQLVTRNEGSQSVEYVTGEPRFDFWVEGPQGLVWVWEQWATAEGTIEWPAALRYEELEPGQSISTQKTWDQDNCVRARAVLPQGRYVARAIWFAAEPDGVLTGGWASNSAEFEIR